MDFNSFVEWLETYGPRIALILLLTWLALRFGMIFIKKSVQKSIRSHKYKSKEDEQRREATLVGIISATLKVGVYALAMLLILTNIGVDIGPLIAGAGIAGVALGFGAQSLVTDFISGVFIILENQYRVGDVIEVGTESGVVEKISVRTTVLRNLDGERIYIPNGEIRVATNMTMEYAQINLNVGVAYDSDIDKVKKIINKVGLDLAGKEDFKHDIVEPPEYLRLDNFGDSSIDIKIMGKVKAGEQWRIMGQMREDLKKAFDKEGIEIPFPQRDIHMRKG